MKLCQNNVTWFKSELFHGGNNFECKGKVLYTWIYTKCITKNTVIQGV